ncbi:MAG TPA: ergothioneine biosynthesis protein EgtB [Variovorax sp.]|nr:ergothioneine biosynthesis protein EgtB [Variovorax sp.]
MTYPRPQAPTASALRDAFREVRAESLARAAPLSPEDQCIQSMPDASPTKWHLAHTTWFFETVLLQPHLSAHRPFDERFNFLFNSYYEALGPRHPRPQRGLLTRPSRDEVLAYRAHVDGAVERLFDQALRSAATWNAIEPIVSLGLQHEQQHQELLVTDILHAFSCNPLLPAYQPVSAPVLRLASAAPSTRWLEHAGGQVQVGHDGDGFAFDNETPRHAALLQPHAIADRLVTCGDYARFIADGGYRNPGLWLSDGWALVRAQGWQAPAYWIEAGDPRLAGHAQGGPADWHVFGLHGVRPLDPAEPVAQLSLYEAAAYAEWAGARLPTEFEWEVASADPAFRQATGHVWQWTRSSYDPYPGFRPAPGIAAEYNGKFMVGQLVLRGGSVVTPAGHTRPSYRNFFPPAARWQFTGLRLAKDL